MSINFDSDEEKNVHIRNYLDQKISKYGDIKYAYAVIKKRKTEDMIIISNIEDYFLDIYLKNNYQNIDPVIAISMNRVSPLFWEKDLTINPKWHIYKTVDSIQPYHNIVSGQTFILHCPDNIMAVLSLYANKFLNHELVDDIKKDKNEIQGILINCYEMITHLYDKKDGAKKVGEDLTNREKEILHWISLGKTYPEVAIILNISVRTVKFHISNVVRKLGVNNAKHAIKLCEELNLASNTGIK